MTDYIKREDAISIIRRRCKKYTTICVVAVTELQELPPADIRENVKGEWTKKWKYGIHYVACSECGYEPRYEGVYIMPSSNTLLFCPNCGADMRGDNK